MPRYVIEKERIQNNIALLQKRVWEMRQLAEKEFTRMKVPYSRSYAGFFSWLNLREYLIEDSYEGEQELYQFIYEHGNVIVAPVGAVAWIEA